MIFVFLYYIIKVGKKTLNILTWGDKPGDKKEAFISNKFSEELIMKIIYGPKGTGKTQKAIDSANAAAQTAKGHVLFVADTDKNMYDLDRAVRFIDAGRFDIRGQEGFRGFLKGLVAANADNDLVYIDSIKRITKTELSELKELFAAMEWLEKEYGVEFVLTCSGELKDLPEFIAKYAE